MSAPHSVKPYGTIRFLADGKTLDDISIESVANVHIEQMDDNAWWVGIYLPDGRRLTFDITAERGLKIRMGEDWEGGENWESEEPR